MFRSNITEYEIMMKRTHMQALLFIEKKRKLFSKAEQIVYVRCAILKLVYYTCYYIYNEFHLPNFYIIELHVFNAHQIKTPRIKRNI